MYSRSISKLGTFDKWPLCSGFSKYLAYVAVMLSGAEIDWGVPFSTSTTVLKDDTGEIGEACDDTAVPIVLPRRDNPMSHVVCAGRPSRAPNDVTSVEVASCTRVVLLFIALT